MRNKIPDRKLMKTEGYKGKKKLEGSRDDIDGIKAALRGFYKGLSEHDLDKISSHTAPGYHLLEHGEYWSLDYLKVKIGNDKPSGYSRSNRFDFKLIEVADDRAFAVWDLYAKVNRDGKKTHHQWLESGSLKKSDGIWKVHILHSTRVEAGRIS